MTHPCAPHQFLVSSKPRRSSIAVYELLNHSSPVSATPNTQLHASTPSSLARSSPIRKHQQPSITHKTTTRGPWRMEEDRLLRDLVNRNGARHWSAIAAHFPSRSGKQARERWMNQLNPALKKKNWTAEEDTLILRAHRSLGNKWSAIAHRLPGRTDNAVKNRFNSTLKRAMRERAQSNAPMNIHDIVSSLHARPLYHDHPPSEPKRLRPDFNDLSTRSTVSSATYDSNTSEERDLWVRASNTNTRMAPSLALASEPQADVRKWTDTCLPGISNLTVPSRYSTKPRTTEPCDEHYAHHCSLLMMNHHSSIQQ